jgi:type I restriction enzyme S subunit
MQSPDKPNHGQRVYTRADSVVFLKTHESFGGLSNMAGGFPLRVNGIRILTSEALYQACRFPHRPEVQALIIEQKSPMTAKMKSKPHRRDSRPDWNQVRVNVMRWCLRVKLAQNWIVFSRLLLETGERPIVEESRKDSFWGAMANDDGTLAGMNVLGRLLMELRETIKERGREAFMRVEPLGITDFLLAGRPIETFVSRGDKESGRVTVAPAQGDAAGDGARQSSLFGESAVMETPPIAYSTVTRKGVRIADLKPYPECKDSGLPWIGQIPEHWEMIPNRGLVRRRKVLVGRRYGDYRLLSLTKQGVIVRDISTGKGKFSSDMGTSQEVRRGDLVFCFFDVPETPRTVGLSRYDGMITGAYTVFESLGRGNPQYFELFYRAMDDRKLLSPLYSGLRNTIPVDRFLGTKTPLPPPDEQAAIVRFLDWASWRLERAIRAKRKVIALLNEQKQAIIHHAVTRGLDPSVPLKPSGIPWLGDIPQHWEVTRICHLFQQVVRHTAEGNEPKMSMSRRYGLIRSDQLSNRAAQAATSITFSVCEQGDLVMNKYQAHNGLFGAATERGLITSNYSVFAPIGSTFAEFYSLLFASPIFRVEFRMRCQGVGDGMMPLYSSAFLKTPTLVPPATEQRSIVTFITESTRKVSQAISRLEREISLLHEYRIRLVADVVTGKLDVREGAARLPNEAPLCSIEDLVEPDDEVEAADEEAVA